MDDLHIGYKNLEMVFGISRNQQLFDFDFVQKPKTQ